MSDQDTWSFTSPPEPRPCSTPHGLGLEVVGEGIETQGQYQLLKDLGCDMGQSFHIGRPCAPRHLEELLAGSELTRPEPS